MTFVNKDNGYEEDNNLAFLWCLLFGGLYFAYKGVWTHFVVSFILAVLTFGISWFIYPLFASGVVRKNYLRHGWVEVT